MTGPTIVAYRGKLPVVAAGTYVAPTVSIIGDVTIGAESSIWFGAVLRGDVQPITIGARTSIHDNGVVHATDGWVPTVVGDDCTVGHMVLLHGCTIGDRVLVGMGSIVMDDAHIGSDCIIGAGSLVTARQQIPPGVLAMGRPAKVIRELRPEEFAQLRDSSAHYASKAREYLAEP
ncbi:MAG: gamma carbonic anhydrase family protein [Deltaproteobacteria bacterium]|nr:gamma carbonic anhydrase family protein [Deltaproteobacteria bacterium]